MREQSTHPTMNIKPKNEPKNDLLKEFKSNLDVIETIARLLKRNSLRIYLKSR